MKCENCGNEHDGSYGSGRFCSEKCKQEFIGLSPNPCKCKYCGKEFKNGRSLGGHVVYCKRNPNRNSTIEKRAKNFQSKLELNNPLEDHIVNCVSCGCEYHILVRHNQFEMGNYNKTCSDSCAHRRKHTKETKQKLSNSVKSFIQNNGSIGAAKPKERIMMEFTCEECGDKFKSWNLKVDDGSWFSHRFCSTECSNSHKLKMLSSAAKQRCERGEFGGLNNETYKKHKHGWYKGLYCGSSWELAFVLWKTHQGFKVNRCNLILPYEYNGKVLNYYPDYEIDGTIYEIKGFEDYKAQAKHNAYPEIEYYNRDRMKPIIKEVKKLFGKNFVDLLEDHK